MSPLHSSKRRPAPLKPGDYDHEIDLIDHTKVSPITTRSRSQSANPALSREASRSSSRRHSDAPLRKHNAQHLLREEIARQKYGKYREHASKSGVIGAQIEVSPPEEDVAHPIGQDEERGRSPTKKPEPDSQIDILYENQRGGFLCGVALFSGSALGNLDPAPWTNSVNKTSATNITNAQVPDPSWEWVWKEWKVNLTDEVDEDGWEYSFMFAKAFSWHGPSWWNSFVRRRAWIRKRVKRQAGYSGNQAHMLNPDYFTIHPVMDRSRSPASTVPQSLTNRYSATSIARREMEEEAVTEDITNIGALMKALRLARIDREKMEAVENFIEHGGDDLYYLQDHMHEIMRTFIFQASRRLLLSHLLKIFNEASERKKSLAKGESIGRDQQRRLSNLEAAVSHADEEVKRLEFWSDVKDMAEKGETKGALDENQGWGTKWTGIDYSGPKALVLDRKLPGTDNCKDDEGNGTAIPYHHESEKGKGKGKAME